MFIHPGVEHIQFVMGFCTAGSFNTEDEAVVLN